MFTDFSQKLSLAVRLKLPLLEPWTGPSVQFSDFPELWTELCVRFIAVQVRTAVQDRTLTPLTAIQHGKPNDVESPMTMQQAQ